MRCTQVKVSDGGVHRCLSRDGHVGPHRWSRHGRAQSFEGARCSCGKPLCGRDELGAALDGAMNELGAARPLAEGNAVVDLAGHLAAAAFEVLRASSLLRMCPECSRREIRAAAVRRAQAQ